MAHWPQFASRASAFRIIGAEVAGWPALLKAVSASWKTLGSHCQRSTQSRTTAENLSPFVAQLGPSFGSSSEPFHISSR